MSILLALLFGFVSSWVVERWFGKFVRDLIWLGISLLAAAIAVFAGHIGYAAMSLFFAGVYAILMRWSAQKVRP